MCCMPWWVQHYLWLDQCLLLHKLMTKTTKPQFKTKKQSRKSKQKRLIIHCMLEMNSTESGSPKSQWRTDYSCIQRWHDVQCVCWDVVNISHSTRWARANVALVSTKKSCSLGGAAWFKSSRDETKQIEAARWPRFQSPDHSVAHA